jgi:cobalt-zinc-cadmium efflux system membrane fusion protein
MNRFQLVKTAPLALTLSLIMVLATWGCGSEPRLGAALETHREGDEHADEQTERCERHDLPVSDCFICDPRLRESGRLWCAEHDRYEDRCFVCHPELEESERLWCSEHNLYEDECTLCHPELRDAARPSVAVGVGLQCQEHGVPEEECGICHPELAVTLEPGSGLKIRFESARSADKAGVKTARPVMASSLPGTEVLARVTYDQNRFARVTPLAGGVVDQVLADVGQSVSRGDHLAILSSPGIARAKSEYLSARVEEVLKFMVFKREQELVARKISARQDYEQANAEHEIAKNTTAMARQQLLNFGLTEQAILLLEQSGSASSELEILAPFSGTIVDRHAVQGEAVAPGDALFMIADLSSMWLELSISEDELSSISIGQPLVATFDAQAGLEVSGRLTWVGTSVDEESRMVKGRAVVPNPDRVMRHGMFGRAHLHTEVASNALYVPVDAVQQIDGFPFVFVPLADDLFELRRVALGGRGGAAVAVVAGLNPEDEIVVTHSFTLKSEFLKSRLGAGCVDE